MPPADEVIPNSSPSQEGGWCAVLTEEDVAALVGADQTERVRQSGQMSRTRTTRECTLYWADGREYTTVATIRAINGGVIGDGDMGHRRILPVIGEGGRLVADGSTVELGDGVYRHGEYVVTWTVLGPDEEQPAIAETALYIPDGLPGEISQERLAEIGEQMQSMTAGLVDWQGQARPFAVEDLARLLEAGG
ncbi:hypothetical protein [Georgenia faecalis]|uniref:Uncharacterized protein n=1 Tax=Georgenia faecalis TaxID=2483799 RepID=A0ABV9D5A6_9MICO|nr:hypothetical protein [Georgenia faecalis]